MTTHYGDAPRARRAQIALTLVGLFLAVVSLLWTAVGGCPACGDASGIRLGIGIGGTAGYLALVVAAIAGRETLFQVGVLAVAAIHTTLVTWMVTTGSLCPLCVAAAIAAFANATVGLASGRAQFEFLERIYLPALLVASGVVFALAVREGSERAESIASAKADLASVAPLPSDAAKPAVRILVYENDHCEYCREFREQVQPALAAEFGDVVRVEFRDASDVPWVRRTPTIAIEGGALFEGLPLRYSDLRDAVVEARSHSTHP